MKKYLVSYWNGIKVESLITEVEEDYVPSKDNCKLLKNEIINKCSPEWLEYHCVANGGYVNYHSIRNIKINELKLIAVSNLDI